MGVFRAAADGTITPVVTPGDPAPGGGTFDLADMPSINAHGDVAFGGHVDGAPCVTFAPQDSFIHCDEDLFVKRAPGGIERIVGAGDPAPGGGVFRSGEFPTINAGGDVVFIGDLTPPPGRHLDMGVVLYRDGHILPIARPGQSMPGGGHLVQAFALAGLNDQGEVGFGGLLDSDTLGLGYDTGVYTWSNGTLQLVARTGTSLAGLGLLDEVDFPSVAINDRGRLLFAADAQGDEGFAVALFEAAG